MASRSRIFATTGSGALPRKAALPSFARACAISFSAAARSLVSRARSAATSIDPGRSSATPTAPGTARVAVAWKSVTGRVQPEPATGSAASWAAMPGAGQPVQPGRRPAASGCSPWSERNRRTSVTTCCTLAISRLGGVVDQRRSATGQAAVTTVSPPVSAIHSSSVTNGIDRVQQPQQLVEHVPEHPAG